MKDNSRPIGVFDSGIGGKIIYIMVIPRMLHMAHARSLTFSI